MFLQGSKICRYLQRLSLVRRSFFMTVDLEQRNNVILMARTGLYPNGIKLEYFVKTRCTKSDAFQAGATLAKTLLTFHFSQMAAHDALPRGWKTI